MYTIKEPHGVRKSNARKPIQYEINNNGCWVCVSHALNNESRTTIHVNGKKVLMHRYVYTLYKGEIPHGNVIMHTCDNPTCINPAHLNAGTQLDNIKDRDSKGRVSRKITEEIRSAIRQDTRKGVVVAQAYGITPSYVSMIRRGKV